MEDKILFYSQNWERTKVLTFSVLPRFDILITERFLYLIELPSSLIHDVGGVMLGLVGQSIATSAEKKVGNKIRSTWLDSNGQLISDKYKKMTLFKIPKENLKNSLLLKKNFNLQRLAIFTYNDKRITLKGNKEEYDKLKSYIESYLN